MVTDSQVIALWKEFKQVKVIKIAALKTGMNRKTASKYLKQQTLPSEIPKVRNWRTRPDPLKKIWIKAEEFLSITPNIEAKALFDHLLEQYPNDVKIDQLRTFQRRVKRWRIKEGANQEVYFDQLTVPGKLAQLDWIDMNKFEIIINKKIFKHKLSHFTLVHSNIESATICSSESLLAIKKGLRDFLYRVVGKAPQILQVDNSSAATHRPSKEKSKRVFNSEYLEVLKYYGMDAQKTNVKKPNENGVIESQNGHLKKKITQALLIRGSREFENLEHYKLFIDSIIDKANSCTSRQMKLNQELPLLKTIPTKPLPEYREEYVTIRNRSTVFIKRITYSVPSRLIGSKLKARIYEHKIDLYSGADLVYSMPKYVGSQGAVINYRHVIHSLIRKPAAFENYKYKKELYPTPIFQQAWEQLIKDKTERQATIEYLRILKLAADNFEQDVETALELILSDDNYKLDAKSVSDLIVIPPEIAIATIDLKPNLNIYDQMFLTEGDNNYEGHYQ